MMEFVAGYMLGSITALFVMALMVAASREMD